MKIFYRLRLLLLVFACSFLVLGVVQAQIYSVKGGLSLGFQKWNEADRSPLYRYHFAVTNETYNQDNSSAIYAQLGYHVRGSAIRFRRGIGFTDQGQQINISPFTIPYEFNNLGLTLGFKKKRALGESKNRGYWLMALRTEYTLSTNLKNLKDPAYANPFYLGLYPAENFVRRFNYGVTVGAGIEIQLSDLIGTMLEFNISPDFSRQYYSPTIPNIYNPYTGQNYTQPEQTVRNISMELTLGIRFLRIVEYID